MIDDLGASVPDRAASPSDLSPSGSSQSGIHRAVLFLDFDGVICSPRAFAAQKERWSGDQHALRWADPIACDMVQQLLVTYRPWLVISSTWRFMEKSCHQVLGRYDLSRYLHTDWRTGEDSERQRGREVETWLAEHDNPPFVILDDDNDFTAEQQPWLVQTEPVNGMMLADFDKAEKLFASAMSTGTAKTPQAVEGRSPASAVAKPGAQSPAQPQSRTAP